jgi:hypothetical protein
VFVSFIRVGSEAGTKLAMTAVARDGHKLLDHRMFRRQRLLAQGGLG